MKTKRKDNPIDELIRNPIEGTVALIQVSLMIFAAIYFLEEIGQTEFIDPLLQIFDLFLLFSDIEFLLVFIAAILFIGKIASSQQTGNRVGV